MNKVPESNSSRSKTDSTERIRKYKQRRTIEYSRVSSEPGVICSNDSDND